LFTTKKIAIVSVINDLVTDNRVNRTCLTLVECGYDVTLIGRLQSGSMAIPDWPFKTIRMNLILKSGPPFYLFFMLRLFFKLLFKKADLLYANDLDTLLPNYLVSRIKALPLIYDSHELFCEVPELQNAHLKRRIWLSIESWVVPKLKYCVTVNDSIARIFTSKYKVIFTTVKNIADSPEKFIPKSRKELALPLEKKIILLQGAGINIDRGAEELIESMQWVNNTLLLIIGSGDSWPFLKQKIKEYDLEVKVKMINKIPTKDLMHYTYNADLGMSIDKNTNLNYYYSLPNKIFDYLHAGIPVLASRLPEIENIITNFEVGDFIETHDPLHIATKINELLASHHLLRYKGNTLQVKKELNWNNEKIKLMRVIKIAEEKS